MKRAVIYARVSGSSHQEKEETIETQLAELHKAYKTQNIVKEYTDICSGAYLSRTGLNELREDAKKRMFDVIYVYSLDRLSRKLGHQIALLEEFEKLGIEVEVLGERYENTPEGMLNRNIRGAFSEYERYKITKRMKDGKYRKAEEGRLVASYPTFGYKYIKKTENCDCEKKGENHFEIDQKEAKIVKLMFKIYLETHSQRETAKRLEKLGIKGRSRWKNKPTPINYRILSRFLRNETYIGNYYFGKSYFIESKRHYKENPKSKLTHRIFKPRSEWKLIKVPAIIDKATFDMVQEILKQKAKESLKPTKHQYLCQGLIKCLKCGRRYSGGKHETYNGKDYLIYRCPQKYKRALNNESPCKGKSISVEKLDREVWRYLKALLSQPEKIKKSIRILREKRESNRDFNQTIYDSLISKKAEIKKNKSKLFDLYVEEKYKKEDLDDKISELNSQEEMIDQQIEEVKGDLTKIDRLDLAELEIEQVCLAYQEEFGGDKEPSFELKRRTIRKFVKEINIPNQGNPIVKVIIPKPEKPLKFSFLPKIKLFGVEQTTPT